MSTTPFSLTLALIITSWQPAFAALSVFACEPEWATLAREIGGDNVEVFAATTALQDAHNIEARPSMIAKMRRADLVVCSGAELEAGWLPLLLRQAGNSRVQPGKPGYFEASHHVKRLDIPVKVNRMMGDVHASGSPHVHLDPHRLLSIAQALSTRLTQIDSQNAADYQAYWNDFKIRWLRAISSWEARAAPLKTMKAVVHHKDWVYLFDWLGIEQIGTLEPKPGLPPTATHLAALKQQLQQTPANMIIRAAYNDARAAQWLHDHTGIPVISLPYTVGGSKAADDLFSLFEDTLNRLLAVNP